MWPGNYVHKTFFQIVAAINCFKCKSSDNANCTHIHPSGVAVPAANCDNPDELVKDWIRGYLKTIKLGDFAEIDLKKLFNFTTNTVDDKAELKGWKLFAKLF